MTTPLRVSDQSTYPEIIPRLERTILQPSCGDEPQRAKQAAEKRRQVAENSALYQGTTLVGPLGRCQPRTFQSGGAGFQARGNTFQATTGL
jgi:hypothetical protein